MIKVIRKTKVEPVVEPLLISLEPVPSLDTDEGIIFLEAVKKSHSISYDESGTPSVEKIDLGIQYDHRVTWLDFDLDKLLWHLHGDYNNESKYYYYTFKIANVNPLGESEVWEFDGKTFEIPDVITKTPGEHTLILIIEEFFGDEVEGNIKTDDMPYKERFISKPLKATVAASIYDPADDIVLYNMETDQKSSLTKPKINCTLADDGTLQLDQTVIGEKLDNFVTYLKFDPSNLTAHLREFTLATLYRQGDKVYGSIFEKAKTEDPFDDSEGNYPLISWIPRGVYQNAGDWDVVIFAFAGRLEDINDEDDTSGSYYFYLSKQTRVTVKDNLLSQDDLDKEARLSILLNLLTNDSEGIVTADNQYYVLGGKGND